MNFQLMQRMRTKESARVWFEALQMAYNKLISLEADMLTETVECMGCLTEIMNNMPYDLITLATNDDCRVLTEEEYIELESKAGGGVQSEDIFHVKHHMTSGAQAYIEAEQQRTADMGNLMQQVEELKTNVEHIKHGIDELYDGIYAFHEQFDDGDGLQSDVERIANELDDLAGRCTE